MVKILVTREIPENYIEQLKEIAEVEVYPESLKPMPREDFINESKDKAIVITMLSDKVDKEYIDQCPELKGIINLAVGYDNIDVQYANEKGIKVCNTPDVLTETTAELGFTLMLVTARRIIEAEHTVSDGKWVGWAPYLLAGQDVYNKTVGIFGMGKIGQAFARRCKGFNMNIMYHNRSEKPEAAELGAKYVDMDKLLAESDYVVCTAPLTDETKHVFNKDAFSKMKENAVFINIGRGGHVVEEDLLAAIQNNEIYAAGLDVLETEPIKEDHPFLKEDRIVVLPHIGSASIDTRNHMIQLCVDNAVNIADGKEPKTEVKL